MTQPPDSARDIYNANLLHPWAHLPSLGHLLYGQAPWEYITNRLILKNVSRYVTEYGQ